MAKLKQVNPPVAKSSGKKKNSWVISLPLTLLMVALAVFGINFTKEYLFYRELKAEADALDLRLVQEELKYEQLQEAKALLFNESYIERYARKNLGMIKIGETLVYPMEAKEVPVLNVNIDDSPDNIH